jgi:hypothetical protein
VFTAASIGRSRPADRTRFPGGMRMSAANTLLNAVTAAVMTFLARFRASDEPDPHLTLR